MANRLDLAGQTFGYLTALSPTEKRDKSGNIIWLCKCNKCGKETEIIGRELKRGKRISCGCASGEGGRKRIKELNEERGGTSPGQQNMKTPKNSSTGVKGVSKYYSHGNFRGYRAYITYKGETINGGVFDTLEEAKARRMELESKFYREEKLTAVEARREQDIMSVQSFYEEHGRTPLMKDFGNKSRAMINRSGSWNNLLLSAGLEPNRLKRATPWTRQSLIELAQKQAKNGVLNRADFTQRATVVKVFGSWDIFAKKAGLMREPRSEPNYLGKPFTQYTYDELLEHLVKREQELGRAPMISDVTIFPYYVEKFGSWSNALRQAGIRSKYGWGKYTQADLINLAQSQCDENGFLSTSEFTHYYQAVKAFGSWDEFKKEAGLLKKKYTKKPEEKKKPKKWNNKNKRG